MMEYSALKNRGLGIIRPDVGISTTSGMARHTNGMAY